ncbi:MAG TPA: VCBS repeat-containing protein [bacterium]|nr:VCBS repeat-containing protein [bacterium]
MKPRAIILITFIITLSMVIPARAAEKDGTRAATAFFFSLVRMPKTALKDTVAPDGDDYFTRERFGLERSLRDTLDAALGKYSKLDFIPAPDMETLRPAAEDAFNFFAISDKEQDFLNKTKIKALAEKIDAELIVFGILFKLDIYSDPKTLGEKWVNIRLAVLVYDKASDTFTYSKTYERNSNQAIGLPDPARLKKILPEPPAYLVKFAKSETGRVFLDVLSEMSEEMPNSLATPKFLKGDYAVTITPKAKTTTTPGQQPDGNQPPSEAKPDGPPDLTPSCSSDGRIILTAPTAAPNVGVASFPCRNKHFNFSAPENTSGAVFSDPTGIGSISTGDYDGDGSDELAVSSLERGERVHLFKLNKRALDPAQPAQVIYQAIPGSDFGLNAAFGDFDGDKADELALTLSDVADYTFFYKFDGSRLSPVQQIPELFNVFGAGSGAGANLAAGDFNGDGRDELALSSAGAGEMIKVFSVDLAHKGQTKLISELKGYFGNTCSSTSLAAGDFDGDGRDELVLASQNGGVRILVLRYEDKGFDPLNPMADLSADWGQDVTGVHVSAGDVDGDNIDDLLVTTSGNYGSMIIMQYSHGRFLTARPYLNAAPVYSGSPSGFVSAVGKLK